MTNQEKIAEYRRAMYSCHIAATMLLAHDLDEILGAIEHADALAPMLDPTLYREKSKAMHEDRDLLEAARPLWDFAKRHMEKKP